MLAIARARRPVVLVALAMSFLCVCMLAPPSVRAATSVGPATWSGYTPADDSSVIQARPKISVVAYDPAGIKQTGYTVMLDGVALRPSFSYKLLGWNGGTPILDKRYVTLTATLRSDIAYGWHAVQARVTNNLNIVSEGAWSFWRSGAPALDDPQPAPGSITTNRTPQLSVAVISNANGLTGSFTLDGVVVSGVYNASTGVLSGVPATSLAVGTHSVTVTAANAFGYVTSLEWEFQVDLRLPQAQVTDCVSCHQGRPVGHDMTACSNCHAPDGPLGEDMPIASQHSPYYLYSPEYDCLFCHGREFATVPLVHAFSPDPYHDASTGLCSDQECHARSFDAEHNHNGMTCLTCHASTDPLVIAAIQSGSRECASCHPDKVDGEGSVIAHAFDPLKHTAEDADLTGTWPAPGDNATYNPPYAFSANCSDCHALLLTEEHTVGCVTCHPVPRNTFTAWDKSCTQAGCHTVAGTAHEAAGASHAMGTDDIDGGCGFVNPVNGRRPCHYRDLVQEHNRTVNERINPATGIAELKTLSVTCVECHDSAAFAALGGTWTGSCNECHDGTTLVNHSIVGSARYEAVYAEHDNPSGYYDNGAGNSGSNAMDAHGWIRPNPDPNSANKTIGCGVPTCHTAAYIGGGWPWYTVACSGCHGPSIAVPDPYQGDYAWYSDYWFDDEALDTRLTMTLEPVTLPTASVLQFKTWYDIESNWDHGYVQISTDGGATWTNLPGNITTNDNPFGQNLGNGITGGSGGWVDGTFDLSAYAGLTVQIRFAYIADFYTYGLGWMLDVITVGPEGAPVFSDDCETLKPEWGVQTYVTYYDWDLEEYVTVPTSLTGWRRYTRTP